MEEAFYEIFDEMITDLLRPDNQVSTTSRALGSIAGATVRSAALVVCGGP